MGGRTAAEKALQTVDARREIVPPPTGAVTRLITIHPPVAGVLSLVEIETKS